MHRQSCRIHVNGASWLHGGFREIGTHFLHDGHGDGNLNEWTYGDKTANETIFTNCSLADAETVGLWHLTLAWAEDQLPEQYRRGRRLDKAEGRGGRFSGGATWKVDPLPDRFD